MTTAKELFGDYCYFRNYTANVQKLKQSNPFIRELKETPERLKLFEGMAGWCREQGVNPREWLYSLFTARRWLFAPKLHLSHLQSEKHIPKFRRPRDMALFRQRVTEEAALSYDADNFDPNRDINATAENAKRYYLRFNDTVGCMQRMDDETFGFHPRSLVCARCPAKAECQVKLESSLNCDVMALRRGEITSEEAKAQALIRVQTYGK